MLMYSKEANNRKQEIDRQHHTIPNQRANDKHHGNVYNLLFRYGKVRSQNIKHSMKSTAPADCVTEIRIGNSVLVVSGFFKQSATETAADKMAKVLEAEAATQKSAI